MWICFKLKTKRSEHLSRCCSGSLWLSLNRNYTALLDLYRIFLLRFLKKVLIRSGRFKVAVSSDNDKNLASTKYKKPRLQSLKISSTFILKLLPSTGKIQYTSPWVQTDYPHDWKHIYPHNWKHMTLTNRHLPVPTHHKNVRPTLFNFFGEWQIHRK